MSARYWVLASDELMNSDPQWPACLRPVQRDVAPSAERPGMCWWLFEDDDAPETLNGKRIELEIRAHYDEHGHITRTEIAGRRPAP